MIVLEGPWHAGLAFDIHTLSSAYLGVDEYGHERWDSERSEMGELVYQLKYKRDAAALPQIVALLDKVKGIEGLDCIVPIPPSDKSRAWQPVTEIAKALGKHRNVNVLLDVLDKKPGGQSLKNVQDPNERRRLLEESLTIGNPAAVAGRTVLLVDDLYRSGATLKAATELLLKAQAKKIAVLTMTKTRSNR